MQTNVLFTMERDGHWPSRSCIADFMAGGEGRFVLGIQAF
jgi:hypothetical protein